MNEARDPFIRGLFEAIPTMRLDPRLGEPIVGGNYAEAAFWIVLAGILVHRTRRSPLRRLALVAALLLVLFGLSDVVEAQTGAWWRPPGLLVWKGSCLIGLLACLQRWLATRQARTPDGDRTADPGET